MSSFVPWPDHPCQSHRCDGCHICRVGECCCSSSRSTPSMAISPRVEMVRELLCRVEADTSRHSGIRQRVAIDCLTRQRQHEEQSLQRMTRHDGRPAGCLSVAQPDHGSEVATAHKLYALPQLKALLPPTLHFGILNHSNTPSPIRKEK